MLLRLSLAALLSLGALPALAAEVRVYPSEVTISGPNRVQQLIVVRAENGRVVADLTAGAKFASSDEKVAKVDDRGRVIATGSGNATITATAGNQAVEVKITATARGDTGWTFRNHIIPTLTRAGCNSGACHGALAGKGGMKLSLRGFDPESDWFVLTRQALARRVDLAKPNDSLMLKKPARIVPHGGGTRFEDGDASYSLIESWIRAGAPGPSDTDARLERIEVFPPAAMLKPKDTLRVIARAVYSNGTTEDVTRWARFGSSEELVASVDEHGAVTVNGHGETAIVVNFGTKVATLTVTSPFLNSIGADVFAKSPRNNFVDELVLKKLELLRLPPSGTCTDAEFVRRAYLDTCGIVPPVAEAERFLKDTDPKKRDKLINRLLERPEFVDYWAYRWSDLLLVSSRKRPQPAM